MKISLNNPFTEDGLDMTLSHAVKESCRVILAAVEEFPGLDESELKKRVQNRYLLMAPGWPLRWLEAMSYLTMNRRLTMTDDCRYYLGESKQ